MKTRASKIIGYTSPVTRWVPLFPKALTLDAWKRNEHPQFLFFLMRNGHRVSAYGDFSLCLEYYVDRVKRFPLDDWAIFDRDADKVIEFTAAKTEGERKQ